MNERRPHIARAREGRRPDGGASITNRKTVGRKCNRVQGQAADSLPRRRRRLHVTFPASLLDSGRFRGGFANGTQRRQFARHASICQCQGGLRAPLPTLPFGMELLGALHSSTNRSMNHVIEIGKDHAPLSAASPPFVIINDRQDSRKADPLASTRR